MWRKSIWKFGWVYAACIVSHNKKRWCLPKKTIIIICRRLAFSSKTTLQVTVKLYEIKNKIYLGLYCLRLWVNTKISLDKTCFHDITKVFFQYIFYWDQYLEIPCMQYKTPCQGFQFLFQCDKCENEFENKFVTLRNREHELDT